MTHVPVASCGQGDCWRIYDAVSQKAHAHVREASVWILDKKGLLDLAKTSSRGPRAFDAFFEQQRKGCGHMTRVSRSTFPPKSHPFPTYHVIML